MYMFGDGVKQDEAEAARWFRKAAEQGSAGGQNNLAAMYMTGSGVKRDYVQAYMWSELASASPQVAQANIAAQNRAALVKLMTPAQVADAQALVREWKPSGNDEAISAAGTVVLLRASISVAPSSTFAPSQRAVMMIETGT